MSIPRFGALSLVMALLLPLSLQAEESASKPAVSGPPAATAGTAAASGTDSWVVGVAAFTMDKLTDDQQFVGTGIQNRLLGLLKRGGVRHRDAGEAEALSLSLKTAAREKTAKDVETAQTTLDSLLFKGYPDWKYRSEREKATEALEKAWATYRKSGEDIAAIPERLSLSLATENQDGKLLTAPKEGEEKTFCTSSKLDALLMGSLTPWYGRLLLRLRLYSPWLGRDIYTDEVAFSIADRELVTSQVVSRFSVVVSSQERAQVHLLVEPEGAQVVIAGIVYDSASLSSLELPPGETLFSVTKMGYEPLEEKVPLFPGDTVDLRVTLVPSPSTQMVLRAFSPGGGEITGAEIHSGALFLGLTPATLTLPLHVPAGLTLTTTDGLFGSSVLIDPGPDAQYAVPLVPLLPEGSKPVETARKSFYQALGRFSLSLPVAFLLTGLMNSYSNSVVNDYSVEYVDAYNTTRIASYCAWGLSGALAAHAVYRFIHYLDTVNDGATPYLESN